MKKRIVGLRVVGIAEGVSLLLLLLVAMPLKYFLGMPEAVKVIGWIHGVLFIAYGGAVLLAMRALKWTWFSVFLAITASVVPAGTFLIDRRIKRVIAEHSS